MPFAEPTKCERCNAMLAPGALVCERCHALVHAANLKRLTDAAKQFEQSGEFAHARRCWDDSLKLLPADSQQAHWVAARIAELPLENQQAPRSDDHRWAKKLGPLAPIAIVLAKGKSLLALLKLNFLFSLFAFIGVYWALFGAAFGIGFAVLILLHEMGHFVDIRRRGLPANMPIFLPGLGAYVRWHALGISAETIAEVSLAGPLAGALASVVCVLIWWQTGTPIWAALAHVSAWLNVLNLIPVWVLDGGQALKPLDRVQRIVLLCVALLLWYGTKANLFALVAAGLLYRQFTRDVPEEGSGKVMVYYAAVMILLGWLLKVAPQA